MPRWGFCASLQSGVPEDGKEKREKSNDLSLLFAGVLSD